MEIEKITIKFGEEARTWRWEGKRLLIGHPRKAEFGYSNSGLTPTKMAVIYRISNDSYTAKGVKLI